MAAKKKNASIGDKLKQVVKGTVKQTAKDLLTIGTIVGPGKVVKAAKAVNAVKAGSKVATKKVRSGVVENMNRGSRTGDYVVGGRAANRTMPKAGKADAKYSYGRDADISSNVKIKDTKSPSGKTIYTGGALQALNQNARLGRTVTQAEARANARGLKAANKPKPKPKKK